MDWIGMTRKLAVPAGSKLQGQDAQLRTTTSLMAIASDQLFARKRHKDGDWTAAKVGTKIYGPSGQFYTITQELHMNGYITLDSLVPGGGALALEVGGLIPIWVFEGLKVSPYRR